MGVTQTQRAGELSWGRGKSAAEAARGAQAFLNIHYIKFSSFWRFCPQKCSGMVPELWYISPTFHHELSSLSSLSSPSILVLSALLLSLPSSLFSFWPTHLYLFSSPKLSKCLSLFFFPPVLSTHTRDTILLHLISLWGCLAEAAVSNPLLSVFKL